MYDFMEYCLRRYYRSSGWNEENQYSNLCSWSRALLDFYTPCGLSLHLSKLPTPLFKPSYTMNAIPSLNGNIGYLYTSRPLEIGTSATVDFKDLVDRFRVVQAAPTWNSQDNDYLVYGRMFFPGARLEAMAVRRLTQNLQYLITAVNRPKSHGLPQIAMQLQYDVGRWCSECSYTTDDGLLGIRALYNFGQPVLNDVKSNHVYSGQWSIGTEIYYGTLDKSGGLSTGLRYRTHPCSSSPPISVTYTLNPIVGHMSTAYVAQVSEELALCSRFDFSIYSYESDLALGFEYRTKKKNVPRAVKKESNGIITVTAADKTEKLEGLMKARLGFSEGLALMWEGRFKNTLFSVGLTADLTNRTNPIRTIGIEVQYFS
ncbi:mitochondrial distribution and morphology protein 10 [Phycomyces blakesleeanus]